MRQPIAFRSLLAALYLGTVVPLLLAIGLLVHLEYRAFLLAEHTATLRELLHALTAPRADAAPPDLPRLAALLDDQLRGTDFRALVLDPAGRPVGAGAPLLTAAEHAALRAGAAPISRAAGGGGGAQMVYALAIPGQGGGTAGTVEGRFAVAAITADLARLSLWLALTIGGAVLLALALAPLVARLATRPLAGLVATARAVGQGRLDARADPPAVREPRELAVTLNAMLDHVQATLDAEARTADALRRFAADASHELRSPLAVIGSGLEVLGEALRRGEAEQARQIVERLGREQEVMRRLVDDLLLLARMEQPAAGGAPLQPAAVEPLPLLEEVVERAQALARGQAVRLIWPAQLPPTLTADPDALRRALNNLVENALRHTPPGRAVTLSVAPDGEGCRFRVADEGEGVAPEHLAHLGERFYRVDTARGRAGGGTGLGLAIVKAVAAAHGGRLELASAPGAGLRADLVIPARAAATARPGWLPPPVAAASGEAAPPPGWLPPPVASASGEAAPPPAPREQPRRRRAAPLVALAGGAALLAAWALSPVTFPPGGPTPEAQTAPTPAGAGLSQAAPTSGLAAAPAVAPAMTPDPGGALSGAPEPAPGPFDRAARIAADHTGGVAIGVEREGGAATIEVTLGDGSEALVDLAQGRVVLVEPGPRGEGRGAERQRVERARIAAAVEGGGATLGFDGAAAVARGALGAEPREVDLVWEEGRLWYEVELADASEFLVDPATGAVLVEAGA